MLIKTFIIPIALALSLAAARADSLVYVVTDSDQFGTVDLTTGAFHQIGPNTRGIQYNLVPGPSGSLLSLTASGNLESINTTTGATNVIGATGLGFNVGDLAEVGGTLYATDINNNLYTVNPSTAVTHLIGPTGIPPIVFNPPTVSDETLYGTGGKLYATLDTFIVPSSNPTVVTPPALYQVDVSAGAATKVAATRLGLSASVDVNGVFYAFHEGLVDPSCAGPSPSPCRSNAEILTLNLTNGETAFSGDVSSSATAIYGASPVAPEPASAALVVVGICAVVGYKWRKHLHKN